MVSGLDPVPVDQAFCEPPDSEWAEAPQAKRQIHIQNRSLSLRGHSRPERAQCCRLATNWLAGLPPQVIAPYQGRGAGLCWLANYAFGDRSSKISLGENPCCWAHVSLCPRKHGHSVHVPVELVLGCAMKANISS